LDGVKREHKGATVTGINGPVVRAGRASGFSMNEMVAIGVENLVGEVIELEEDRIVIEVYEDTTGLKPGAPVYGRGLPLFVELGPGIVGSFFDGIQRPLRVMHRESGPFIKRGSAGAPLERSKAWTFTPRIEPGEIVSPGQTLGEVQETAGIVHKVMVPPDISGRLLELASQGAYTVEETIALLEDEKGTKQEIKLHQRWPVRRNRPFRNRIDHGEPLFTGQRVIDFFFPLAKGGTAAIPGGFGTGKTITQHQLSKWADADVIVYIGCGERGNEMAGILMDFPKLVDPRSGNPLVDKTVFIANTSDMPVAAREASIYTGITIAEYYRDMGFHVAVMADSTSRWAEAMREISGRLEEMPAEEGFPAYLSSRLAEFYERAGAVTTLGGQAGSISLIGAVSPPGSDFSEPVTQHTKRCVSTFWALDKELAAARYFPAINPLNSYTGYVESVASWWKETTGLEWAELRERALLILKEESKLQGIVKLIGEDSLPDDQKMIFQGARLLKEAFLQQSAYDPVDTYSPAGKQGAMMNIIMRFIDRMKEVVSHRIPIYRVMELEILDEVHRMKFTFGGEDLKPFEEILERVEGEFDELLEREA